MTRFSGIHEYQMDHKSRVSIPSAAKEAATTVGLFLYDRGENHLSYLLPGDFVQEGLERYTEQLQERASNPFNGDFSLDDVLKAADAQLNLCKLKCDPNGRVIMNELQRKGKGRQKVTMVGVGNYFMLFWGSTVEFKEYIHHKVHPVLNLAQS